MFTTQTTREISIEIARQQQVVDAIRSEIEEPARVERRVENKRREIRKLQKELERMEQEQVEVNARLSQALTTLARLKSQRVQVMNNAKLEKMRKVALQAARLQRTIDSVMGE